MPCEKEKLVQIKLHEQRHFERKIYDMIVGTLGVGNLSKQPITTI